MHLPHPHRPLRTHELDQNNTLHVICMVSNPVRYLSRFELYEGFAAHVAQSPVAKLYTVECAFGDRAFEVTQPDRQEHLQVRHATELWVKESALNLAEHRMLPRDWKYIAWVDADIEFLNPRWAQETLHQLQHHPVVQMFETAVDLSPTRSVVQVHQGFGAQHALGKEIVAVSGAYDASSRPFWHPGYAWAATRTFWENIGGLIEEAALGSGDHHMALGILGAAERSIPSGLHPNYPKMVLEWQGRALRAGRRDLGCVPGAIAHNWHGPKAKRGYVSRWDILRKHQYNPVADLVRSEHGLIELVEGRHGLRDDIRRYFRQRDEDGRE